MSVCVSVSGMSRSRISAFLLTNKAFFLGPVMSVVQLRYFGGWTLQWHHLSSSGFCEVSLTEEQQGESFQRIRSQTECELEEESVYVSVRVELSCSLSPPNHFYHEGSPVWPSDFLIIGLAPHQQSKDQTGTVLTLSLSPLIDWFID